MSTKKILAENKDYILESLKNGISTSQLAKELNCHSWSIGMYAKKHGVSSTFKQSKNHGKLDNNTDKIKEMYSNGITADKIGQELGFAKCSILRLLRKHGVDTTNKNKFNPPEADKEYIIQAYNEGVNLQDIADKYNCSRPTISQFLIRNNIPSRERDLSQEKIDVVKAYTEEKIGVAAIGQRFNVSGNFVKKYANKAGVMRTHEDYQYNLNINYFKQIDTRNKAYVLGMMYADGCVGYDHTVSLSLIEEDKVILDRIKEDMEYDGPLQYYDNAKRKYKSKPCYTLAIKRVEMAADLLRLGCMPNKTWQIRFPNEDILPTEFIADFCRGYWDGDGHVSKDEKTLAVISNQFFIQEMLTKLPVKNPRLYYKQSTKFTDDPDKKTLLCYVGMKHGVKQLIQFLYGDCENTFYLPRKRDKALYWLSKL